MPENPFLPRPYRIEKIVKETDIEWTFTVATDLQPTFGQFLEVSLPRVGEAPISVSAFGDGWVDLTIRRVGRVTEAVHSMKAGDNVWMRGPYGKGFPVETYAGKHLVIVAGGSGLAPVRSIINYFHDHPDRVKRLDLLLGFKSPELVIFGREIERWSQKFAVTVTVDKAGPEWKGKTGLIPTFVKDIALPDMEKLNVVIVGPPVMMKFTAAEFVLRQVPLERIWVSFERLMSCGLGKCGHCKIDYTYVCLDGPVMNFSQAKELID